MKINVRKILVIAISISTLMLASSCDRDNIGAQSQTDEHGDNRGVVSVKRPIDYGEKHEPRTFEGLDVVDSQLYIEPIEGITDDSFRGVDVSSYIVQKDSGVKYYDFEGNELSDAGFFNFLADCGINWVRVRVWNDPYNAEGEGYGGGNNDVEKAMAIGKLATNAGMRVLIDFHYSDFWADPNSQRAPKAWEDKSLEEKKRLISEYTEVSLKKLLEAGVDVGMVQVGNEINHGMAGETDEQKIYELIKSASGAIREVDKSIKIAVHYTDPQNTTFPEYARKLEVAGVDYDVFAASYYPFWHGNLGMLSMNLKTVIDSYDKDVMVVETSYPYTTGDGDGQPNNVGVETDDIELNYEVSPQGQATAVRDVLETIVRLGDKGLGICYWEPAWVPVQPYQAGKDSTTIYQENKEIWREHGSGWASGYAGTYDSDEEGKYYGGSSWDNQALFDYSGKPLSSINVFKYVFSGTSADKKNDYIKNAGFEESDMTSWNIVGNGVKRKLGNDMRSGDGCLHFWNDKSVEYTAMQKLENIPAGTYDLRAFIQGGDTGENAVFELFIIVNGQEYKHQLNVEGWQMWVRGVVPDVVIPEEAEVIIGVRGKADAGAWGAWDDFLLYRKTL